MISIDQARLAKAEISCLYENMPEYSDVVITRINGDYAVKLLLRYKSDYPFLNKIFEVSVVKQIVGQSDSYI